MKEDENNIIEVEVISEKVSEPDDSRKQKATKTEFDHGKSIAFWGKVQHFCFRFCWLAIVTGIAGLFLTISYSQSGSLFYLVMLIIMWSITGLLVLLVLIGIISRGIMRQYKKRDPNFENHVEDDEIF